MGTIGCMAMCYEWVVSLPPTQQKLRKLYLEDFKDNAFSRIALITLRQFARENLEPIPQQKMRKSLIDSLHYEEATIGIASDQKSQASIPSTFTGMSQQQKIRHVRKLIKESYLLVDLTDEFEQDTKKTYQRQVRHSMFIDQPSLSGSMAINPEQLQKMIKSFKPTVISLLQNYVDFCQQIAYIFNPQHRNFFSKLLLSSKVQIMSKYHVFKNDENYQYKHLKQDIQDLCELLVQSVATQQEILLDYSSQQAENNSHNFMNRTNINTMIMAIIFNDQSFHEFCVNAFVKCFQQEFRDYRNRPIAQTTELVKALLAVQNFSSKKKRKRSENLYGNIAASHQLFTVPDNSLNFHINLNLFMKPARILKTISRYYEPIFKLKSVYEMSKEIQKQFRRQIQAKTPQNAVPPPYTRQSISLIAKWMLNRDREQNVKIIVNILMCYWFIDEQYRLGQKGSCIIPYVEQCQKILKIN